MGRVHPAWPSTRLALSEDKYEEDTIALVLVYVDDVLCATNDSDFKSKMFEDPNTAFGLKDQGELAQYLGVEVQQTGNEIFITQWK